MLTDQDILKKLKNGSMQVAISVENVPYEVILLAKKHDALVFKKVFLRFSYWDLSSNEVCEDESEITIDKYWNLLIAIYAQDGPIDSLETVRLMYLHGFLMNDQVIYKGMLYTKADLSCSPSLVSSAAGQLPN